MSTRIERRSEYTETLIVLHEQCGHESRYLFGKGFAELESSRFDRPECGRCARRRAAQQEEGKA